MTDICPGDMFLYIWHDGMTNLISLCVAAKHVETQTACMISITWMTVFTNNAKVKEHIYTETYPLDFGFEHLGDRLN